MKTGAFIIPTGIGASIGGFAGDASKWAGKFAKKCRLIVNPNVVNAACFSGITENMLYVEGYSLDEFFKGNIDLIPSTNNKIGVIFDKAIPQDVLNVHINTINAVKTVYDIDISGYEITEKEVGVEFFIDSSGASTGNIKNLDCLREAAQKLINNKAEAIAIVCHFPDEQGEDYAKGGGVDPVGGVEAIISHYISKEFQIPCAHAPAFSDISISTELVDPRCAAEYITPTFLPCILIGLSNAPKLKPVVNIGIKQGVNQGVNFKRKEQTGLALTKDEISEFENNSINIESLDFLVIPHNSLGCIPVLEMNKRNKKIYAIKENNTILNVNEENFITTCDIINTYEELLERL